MEHFLVSTHCSKVLPEIRMGMKNGWTSPESSGTVSASAGNLNMCSQINIKSGAQKPGIDSAQKRLHPSILTPPHR